MPHDNRLEAAMTDAAPAPLSDEAAAPGRPVDHAKHAAVLEHAKRLFLHQGFARTTIEQIARAAGVSKVTVYSRYDSKETLFEATVRAKVADMERTMALDPDDARPLAERLTAFGMALVGFLMSPELLAFDRILALEVRHMPTLGRRFFEAGPGRKRAQLAAILKRAGERGELSIDDPVRAAEDLLSLWLGFTQVELKFGMVPDPDATMIAAKVARGVRVFLRAYAA